MRTAALTQPPIPDRPPVLPASTLSTLRCCRFLLTWRSRRQDLVCPSAVILLRFRPEPGADRPPRRHLNARTVSHCHRCFPSAAAQTHEAGWNGSPASPFSWVLSLSSSLFPGVSLLCEASLATPGYRDQGERGEARNGPLR